MSTKIVRFANGDDVVTGYLEVGEVAHLEGAIRLVQTPNGVGAMAWMPYSKDKVQIVPKSQILCVCEPEQEIANVWSSTHGSGIVLPKENKLLLD